MYQQLIKGGGKNYSKEEKYEDYLNKIRDTDFLTNSQII